MVPKGNTKKFTSFWKGPYTVVDKPGDVTYKIQLIGGTQTFVVYRNRLKPCHTPPAFDVNRKAHPVSHEYLSTPYSVPSGDVPGVAGYTRLNLEQSSGHPTIARPTRYHRPPARYNVFNTLVRTQELGEGVM